MNSLLSQNNNYASHYLKVVIYLNNHLFKCEYMIFYESALDKLTAEGPLGPSSRSKEILSPSFK